MILVTGANGYVGVHLIERLCANGEIVRALVRRGCSDDEKAFLAGMGAEVCEADIEETDRLMRALEGVESVVHLLGSIEKPSSGGYGTMHTGKTRRLVSAFKAAVPASRNAGPGSSPRGRGRIVYLSVVGASPDAANLYSLTKWEAEEEIRRSGLEHVILRSSLIFGRETGRRDSKLVKRICSIAARRRVVPLIGGGRNKLQPIYIADLVSCLLAAINADGAPAETWEVAGPRILTLRQITDRIFAALGIRGRILSIPYPLAYLLGVLAGALGMGSALNLEQIKMARCDNIPLRNAAPALCGRPLAGFEEGIAKTITGVGSVAPS